MRRRGLIIAAFAIGAAEGFVYVRREYPIAVRHVRQTIRRAEEQDF
jgi:NADH:ubiquinone oxidoreductase subunit F (NADH-binding)